MKTVTLTTTALAVLTVLLVSSGCSNGSATTGAPTEVSGSPPSDDHSGHDHDNEHEGPHHGHVIELGRSHEYHAEVVEDESAKSVTVYILDKDLKELSIDAASITMNLIVDGQPEAFELEAATPGKSSKFGSRGPSLFEAIHVHEATGKLRVAINGKPLAGAVEHHHDEHDDHDGHNH